MIKLIFNADDFGYSHGVNYGIIDSHVNGVVNSATMMMNMPGAEHAVSLAKQHPALGVGVHLVLTCGKPLCKDVPSLVDENGDFIKLDSLKKANGVKLDELEKEWTAQIERFLSFGLTPTHFDSHHHVHGIPAFHPVIRKLSKKYNVPVRLSVFDKIEDVVPFTDKLFAGFYKENVTEAYLNDVIGEDGQTIEVMCHPAHLDTEIYKGSSYHLDRMKEVDVLTSWTLPNGYELVKY